MALDYRGEGINPGLALRHNQRGQVISTTSKRSSVMRLVVHEIH